MLVDPDKMQGEKTYCRRTRRLFLIRETEMTVEDKETGRLRPGNVKCEGQGMQCTHFIWLYMLGRQPEHGKEIDHWDGNVDNNRFSNLREATKTENSRNADRSGTRWHGADENLECCAYKTSQGYFVSKDGVNFGSFKTAEEANALAKEIRLELNGEFDVSRRPEWTYPKSTSVVIDTDEAVLGRFYCPRVGRLFLCKQFKQRDDGLEYGVHEVQGAYRVDIERKRYGCFASAAEASAMAHGVFDELWGDNGLFVGVRRRYIGWTRPIGAD
jgi:hypothetical protein